MGFKNTLLSQKDGWVLEQVVLKHGPIANMAQLDEVFESIYSRKSDRKRRISLLAKVAGPNPTGFVLDRDRFDRPRDG